MRNILILFILILSVFLTPPLVFADFEVPGFGGGFPIVFDIPGAPEDLGEEEEGVVEEEEVEEDVAEESEEEIITEEEEVTEEAIEEEVVEEDSPEEDLFGDLVNLGGLDFSNFFDFCHVPNEGDTDSVTVNLLKEESVWLIEDENFPDSFLIENETDLSVCENLESSEEVVTEEVMEEEVVEDSPSSSSAPEEEVAEEIIEEEVVTEESIEETVSTVTTGGSSGGGGSRSSSSSNIGKAVVADLAALSTITELSCPMYISDYLYPDSENNPDQVLKLQSFLNEQGFNLPLDGVFDEKTRDAVMDFQLLHREEILAPWVSIGINNGRQVSGFVFKTTRYLINNMVCQGSESYPNIDNWRSQIFLP